MVILAGGTMRNGLPAGTVLTFSDTTRLVDAALQAAMRWRLEPAEFRQLIGDRLGKTSAQDWCGPLQRGDTPAFRATVIVEIDQALQMLFDREEDVSAWLRKPGAALQAAPLTLILRSLDEAERIRDLLWSEVAQ